MTLALQGAGPPKPCPWPPRERPDLWRRSPSRVTSPRRWKTP